MKRPTEDYATMGLNALKRASRKAFARARQNNLEVPIWRDGKIEYINSDPYRSAYSKLKHIKES